MDALANHGCDSLIATCSLYTTQPFANSGLLQLLQVVVEFPFLLLTVNKSLENTNKFEMILGTGASINCAGAQMRALKSTTEIFCQIAFQIH